MARSTVRRDRAAGGAFRIVDVQVHNSIRRSKGRAVSSEFGALQRDAVSHVIIGAGEGLR